MYKRSWVEVDLGQIVKNYKICCEHLTEGQQPMAVVKANAYGHGDVQVARILQANGCRNFAVSNLVEGLRLRNAGITGQILILGFTPVQLAEELYTANITQALVSEEYAEALSQSGFKVKAQFAVDTGMNRIGLDADDPEEACRIIRKYKDSFELTGIFTHFCVADNEDEESKVFTDGQFEKFKAVAEGVKDLELSYVHCQNSAAGLYHEPFGTLVRFGIVLYGYRPNEPNILPEGMKPAMVWKSSVAMVKDIKCGETVGYGRTFKASETRQIATVPTGYADGYNRCLSNKSQVEINGKLAPVVGRVCMDQLMVDVTGLDVKMDDEVILMGDSYGADDMAKELGTINYEVICDISSRVARIYK